MHQPTDKIAHTTAFVTPVVEHRLEREIAQALNDFIMALYSCIQLQRYLIFHRCSDINNKNNLPQVFINAMKQ